MMHNFLLLIAAFALVLLNAFFVAAEFGMVKLRHTRIATIKEECPYRGSLLAKVHYQLDAYLSACQLGITLSSLGLGWLGEPAFSRLFEPLLHFLGLIQPSLIEFISFIIAFSLISFLHIVIGELMPKSLAIRQSEQICLWTAPLLYVFYWLMYPMIWLLNGCSNLLLQALHLNTTNLSEQFHSSAEIKLILRFSQQHGELTSQESNILAHTLELGDLRAIDVMRSYDDMVMLTKPLSPTKLIELFNRYRYSRYPVYDADRREIVGILHVKDFLPLLNQPGKDMAADLDSYIRPAPKISFRLPALALLRQFQEGMPHFALVYGRNNAVIGFLTLDNLLHLVIGVIKDEFHKTEEVWLNHSDGSLTVKGDCPLYALERALDKELTLDLDEQDDVISTVAGLILHQLGAIPKPGDKISFHDFSAVVEKVQGAQIKQVRIIPVKKDMVS